MTKGKIIWLASYPKSGNTWTRAFLLHLFMNPKEPFSPDDISAMSPHDTARYWFEKAAGEAPATWDEKRVASLRPGIQEEIAKYAPDNIFVKTHCALMQWHGYAVIDFALTAGAIYIVRNPLDIVASYAAHSGSGPDHIINVMNDSGHVLPEQPDQVAHLIGSWSEHVQSWTARPNPALHIMRYEDLVERPDETFGGLVRFLGLNPPPDRLERALSFSSFDTLKTMEQKHGFAERAINQKRFFRAGKVGGWRDELNDDQARSIIQVHREQMARFDYIPQGY
ncbi:MAG: sulfotransferase domain-containing protein [Pseudomonadota bacterium]